jgi:hypothetical protein
MASDDLTTTTKPACDLADIDGDPFRPVLRVAVILDRNGQSDAAVAFWNHAYPLRDYARALTIAREYVEVRP